MFCVYFHINPLRNEIFYVGKGSSRRPYSLSDRSKFWHQTVARYGKIVDVAHSNLTEEEANELERFYISRLGTRVTVVGVKRGPLVNLTAGGDGISGHRHSEDAKRRIGAYWKGRTKSPEHIARAVEASAKAMRSPEVRLKQSTSAKEMLARPEMKLMRSNAMKKRFEDPAEREKIGSKLRGRPKSPEHRAKLADALRGRKLSDEHKTKISAGGHGKVRSPETRARMAEAARNRTRKGMYPRKTNLP